MNKIDEVYRIRYNNDKWSYIGLLRNQKKFNINDEVFFVVNQNEIARGIVVGVELPPVENSSYKYKIQLPEELIAKRLNNELYKDDIEIDKVTLICDYIFNNIEEAKESAIKQAKRIFELNMSDIERYFNQFKKLK